MIFINHFIFFKLKKYFLFNLKLVMLIFISSCSTTQLAVDVLKKTQKEIEKPDLTKAKLGPGGVYKIGKPYIINGVRYIPKLDLNYDKYFKHGEVDITESNDYTSKNTHRLNKSELIEILLNLDYIKKIIS